MSGRSTISGATSHQAPPVRGVVVVVPTFQEATNIEVLLRRLRQVVPEAAILIVDDNSPDGTADRATQLGVELGQIEVLRRPAKAGLGSAYRDGFAWALQQGYQTIVQMDADLSHDPAAVPHLLGALGQGADVAVGSRYVTGGGNEGWPAHRRALSGFANWYASIMLGLHVSDVTSGFRAFRADALRRVDVAATRADGYAFQIEVLRRVGSGGGAVAEVPIQFRQRARGYSKISAVVVGEALLLVTWWGWQGWRMRLTGMSVGLRPASWLPPLS